MKRSLIVLILASFFVSNISIPTLKAGEVVVPVMPKPGVMVNLSPAFIPSQLKGIVINPKNPLKFDFLIDKGDGNLNEEQKNQEYTKLVKYFLAALTVPDENQWVNLSPYEGNRIINDDFGKTEMGRDLLGQDYLLKQITSSLMYPESGLGKSFWNKVYEKAYKELGNTNIPVNTFNKVWIVPQDAMIYEKGDTALVIKSHLRVMLEEDYLAVVKNRSQPGDIVPVGAKATTGSVSLPAGRQAQATLPSELGLRAKATEGNTGTRDISSQVIKDIVLPVLEKEVNEGKNFAQLRQVFASMILATWYKNVLKESFLTKVYANKAKVQGVDLSSSPKALIGDPEAIYKQYLAAFKKGVYNYIKEDVDKYTNQIIPRKYFAGGAYNPGMTAIQRVTTIDPAQSANVESLRSRLDMASTSFEPFNKKKILKVEGFDKQTLLNSVEPEISRIIGLAKQARSQLELTSAINQWQNLVRIYELSREASSKIQSRSAKFEEEVTKNPAYVFIEINIVILQIQEIIKENDTMDKFKGAIKIWIDFKKTVLSQYAESTFFNKIQDKFAQAEKGFIAQLSAKPKKTQEYYQLLGVPSTATDEEIKKAYRKKVMELHPDRNKNPKAEQEFKRVGEAYEILSKPKLKAVYDQHGKEAALFAKGLDLKNSAMASDAAMMDTTIIKVLEFWRGWTNLFKNRYFSLRTDFGGISSILETRSMTPEEMVRLNEKFVAGELQIISVDLTQFITPAHPSDFILTLLKVPDQLDHVGYGENASNDSQAMTSYGGIDLNAKNLDLQIKRDGNGVPLPLTPEDISRFANIDGFIPRILEIKPASALPI